jgi:RNA-directed DNA polymerase
MSAHCKGGEAWSTKLERIGALAKSKPETVFNNLGHVISKDMLKELYRELDGWKAVGIDGITKEEYGKRLEENIDQLMIRIRRGTYQSKPSRIVEIPKEDGSTRPLAISCIEDKLVQSAVTKILNEIFEPIFLPSSYGFRPNRNCHDALRGLIVATDHCPDGTIIEIDIQKYFNTIPHEILLECLRKKISDNRFLHLIQVLMRAPIMTGNAIRGNEVGCPQGSIGSPILANIYMHYVIDIWFEEIRKKHLRGIAEQVRYADDMVFIFERKDDAERFFEVLPKRLEKYGLKLHVEKSQIMSSGKVAAQRAQRRGERLTTYQFLGFTCYWGLSRNGKFWRLKYTSRADRFREKVKKLKKYLRCNLNVDAEKIFARVRKVLEGWINYHGISDNGRRVRSFIHHVERQLFWWVNRRGGQKGTNWIKFAKLLVEAKFPRTWKVVSMFAKR